MNAYQYADLPSLVDGEDPHGLVQLMLDGAAARVNQAQGALSAPDIPLKCELIGKAINLVEGLQACLDVEQGGEIAGNLAALYDYIARRLVQANAFNDIEALKEVASLLRELRTGWSEMGRMLKADQSVPAAGAAG